MDSDIWIEYTGLFPKRYSRKHTNIFVVTKYYLYLNGHIVGYVGRHNNTVLSWPAVKKYMKEEED